MTGALWLLAAEALKSLFHFGEAEEDESSPMLGTIVASLVKRIEEESGLLPPEDYRDMLKLLVGELNALLRETERGLRHAETDRRDRS